MMIRRPLAERTRSNTQVALISVACVAYLVVWVFAFGWAVHLLRGLL